MWGQSDAVKPFPSFSTPLSAQNFQHPADTVFLNITATQLLLPEPNRAEKQIPQGQHIDILYTHACGQALILVLIVGESGMKR